jgi:uncharacterized RDD family membrane protein YckC
VTEVNDDAPDAGRPTPGPVRAPAPQPAGAPGAAPTPAAGGAAPWPGQGGSAAPPPAAGQGTPPPGYPPYYGPPPQYGPPGWRPQPVPLSPDGRPLADFGSRLLAYFIDVAILTAITMVVSLPFLLWFIFKWTSEMAELSDPYSGTDPFAASDRMVGEFFVPFLLMELGLFVFLLVAYYIYSVEMMFRSGQTLGKKLIKVRVVPLEPGATLTRGMAAKRYLIEFVGGMFVPFFSYLDGFWQLWDKPYQQTLHDKVAKTVVVKVAP